MFVRKAKLILVERSWFWSPPRVRSRCRAARTETVSCLMTLGWALVAVRRARIWEFQLEDCSENRWLRSKDVQEMTDWCLSGTQASWILMGPAVPPYWLSLAHIGPIWLCWTRGAPVGGWRALGFRGQRIFLHQHTSAALRWGPFQAVKKQSVCIWWDLHLMCFQLCGGSSVHILSFSCDLLFSSEKWSVFFPPQTCVASLIVLVDHIR